MRVTYLVKVSVRLDGSPVKPLFSQDDRQTAIWSRTQRVMHYPDR
jgi:hypothetical protein